MGINCAPLVADLFLYEREFMLSLSDYQTDIIEDFNSTFRYKMYLDDLLNIDYTYFEQIYPTELQLNKANSSDTEALFFYLNLSITNGIVSSNIYDKLDYFYFEIVNSPLMEMFLILLPTVYIFLSSFGSQECVLMLMSTTETYF